MSTPPSRNPLEILIVEDSPTQAEKLKYILKENDFRVVTECDGQKALEAMRARKPTLVITDINMPEMDGYELCRHIRADEELGDLPVILLTSLSDPEDVFKGLECGADNFITKPYDENNLLARIQYLLANVHLRTREKVQISMEVFLAGRKHVITSDRAQILNLLLSTYETAIQKNRELTQARDDLARMAEQLEEKVVERTASLITEIAERKRGSERIAEQAALLDQTQDAIYVRDLDWRIIYWNKGAERLYGWTAEEAANTSLGELFSVTASASYYEEVKRSIMEKGVWTGEEAQVSKSGKKLIVECRRILLRDERDNPKSILITTTDITERKMIQSQAFRTQRMESLGTLAGGVAHDLNNALAPILMGTAMLRMKSPDETPMIDIMEKSAMRAAEMVRQLLTFAKGVEGVRLLIQSPHLFNEMEKIIESTFPKNIQLRTNYAQKSQTILGDATQLHQVLLNLCVNSRDAMPDGGTLTLETENAEIDNIYSRAVPEARPGSYVIWRVSDTGTGIAPEILERIFEPFFSTKGPDKGTGLGLSTTLGIVKSHGGFVQIYSVPGKGSTFAIYLPVNGSSASKTDKLPPAPTPFRGNGETILVVDDETAILQITCSVLNALNFQAFTATDGTGALIQVVQRRAKLSAVITDLHMPHMGGIALVRALRRMSPEIAIIGVSGRLEPDEATEMKGLGVNALLDKPFTQEKLIEALKTVFQK